MKRLLPLALLCMMNAFGASFVFETLPPGGFHSGAPGELIGYGYVLENPDPTRYLLTTNFTAGSFANASVSSLFDFPVLAPGQTISLPFDPNTLAGLFTILLDAGAPIGFVNSGSFVVTGEFYDGDPFNGGTLSEAADDQVAGYEVTVTSAVPEPSFAALTGLIVAAGLLVRSRSSPAR